VTPPIVAVFGAPLAGAGPGPPASAGPRALVAGVDAHVIT